jgi:hypothetical protein
MRSIVRTAYGGASPAPTRRFEERVAAHRADIPVDNGRVVN